MRMLRQVCDKMIRNEYGRKKKKIQSRNVERSFKSNLQYFMIQNIGKLRNGIFQKKSMAGKIIRNEFIYIMLEVTLIVDKTKELIKIV